jgi:hypothetical protein
MASGDMKKNTYLNIYIITCFYEKSRHGIRSNKTNTSFKSKLMQSDAKKFCLLFDVRSHLEKVNKIAIPKNRM